MSGDALRIDGEMTIYRAAEIKQQLLGALAASSSLALDLSAVGEIDTAGVQLLMLTHREAAAAGGALTLVGVSDAVDEALTLLNLSSCFAKDVR